MCGLAGFLGGSIAQDASASTAVLKGMTDTLKERGPDDEGTWMDDGAGVCLGHRRLAIVELSQLGHQPMVSRSGRYVLAFNGEIYNHQELRSKLRTENVNWRGDSDTETLLEAVEVWGLAETLKCSIGMFAIVLWDRRERVLHLARDRLGEKPLYFGWQGAGAKRTFLFASELKAVRKHPAFEATIDRDAVVQYMRHGYVPAPRSIYKGLAKVAPGTIVSVSLDKPNAEVKTYWSAVEAMQSGVHRPYSGSPEQAVEDLNQILLDAVGKQMMADVPLGAFLSGGIDSSTIVALMQAQSSAPIRTFSIGFEAKEYDEATYARSVAAHLGTKHTELYVTGSDALDVVPLLPHMYDEPFGDSSQIPTHLVAKLAKQQVTVALSGDAGDELFGGYTRYTLTQQLWKHLRLLPLPVRKSLAYLLRCVPEHRWNGIAAALESGFGRKLPYSHFGEKIHKGARAMCSTELDELYLSLISLWQQPESLVVGGRELPLFGAPNWLHQLPYGGVSRMMAIDLLTYLPDDILVKVDRAAMWTSLETRVPMLDQRVVEFACALPLSYKLRAGESKWVLKQVLAKYVPKHLVERPKMGFGVPVAQWLAGPLKGWAEDLLSEQRLKSDGIFEPALIRRAWQEHSSNTANRQHQLWNVLMFQSWMGATNS